MDFACLRTGKGFSEKLYGRFVRFCYILITVNGLPVRTNILLIVLSRRPT